MRESVVLASLLLLAACGQGNVGGHSPSPSPTAQALTVATGTASGATNTARLEGVLHGRVNSDKTACFWIVGAGKSSAGPVAVMWPRGSRALPSPLRVVNAEGRVLGRVGEHTVMAGGFVPRSKLPITGCPDFKHAFVAQS